MTDSPDGSRKLNMNGVMRMFAEMMKEHREEFGKTLERQKEDHKKEMQSVINSMGGRHADTHVLEEFTLKSVNRFIYEYKRELPEQIEYISLRSKLGKIPYKQLGCLGQLSSNKVIIDALKKKVVKIRVESAGSAEGLIKDQLKFKQNIDEEEAVEILFQEVEEILSYLPLHAERKGKSIAKAIFSLLPPHILLKHYELDPVSALQITVSRDILTLRRKDLAGWFVATVDMENQEAEEVDIKSMLPWNGSQLPPEFFGELWPEDNEYMDIENIDLCACADVEDIVADDLRLKERIRSKMEFIDLQEFVESLTWKQIIGKQKQHLLGQEQQNFLHSRVEKMLKAGIIEVNDNPVIAMSTLVVPKKGLKKFCLVVDFRPLNKVTLKVDNTLPLIDLQLDRIRGNSYFCGFDLLSGFDYLACDKQAGKYFTFTTPWGVVYSFLGAPQGWCNTPSLFSMRQISEVLQPAGLWPKHSLQWIDDSIIMGGGSLNDSYDNTEKFMKQIQRNQL
eukprot:augustus_masked-scaffold_28-processed-gene-3.91-mRNA-1 protein AED:1.00 eAED:1.00 QI:0/0/0/0/1/1/3/0/505